MYFVRFVFLLISCTCLGAILGVGVGQIIVLFDGGSNSFIWNLFQQTESVFLTGLIVSGILAFLSDKFVKD